MIENIKTENDYLIHLLYCAIHDNQPKEIPSSLSFEKVLEIGKEHEVANIAYSSIEKLTVQPDEAVLKEWKQFYLHAVLRHMYQMNIYESIRQLFAENKIPHTEIQGTETKKLYPMPDYRMMSDIDIVIDNSRVKEAMKALKTIGFIAEQYETGEIQAYNNNGMMVELHPDLFDNDTENEILNDSAFYKSKQTDLPMEFKADELVLFRETLNHTLKHYLGCGMGVRRLLDLYYLKHHFKNYYDDVTERKMYIDREHYEDVKNLFDLAEYWFGEGEKVVDDTIADKIFKSGNHGTFDNYMDGNNNSKAKKVLNLFFPKKQALHDRFEFCRKHNLPVLVCYVYRIGYSITKKSSWRKFKSKMTRIHNENNKGK